MTSPLTFLELPDAPLESAEVLVARAPYEGTVSYGRGTAKAPDAILTASRHLETFDEELAFEHEGRVHYHVLPEVPPRGNEPPESYLPRLTRALGEALGLRGATPASAFVLGLGGEHSVSAALIEAYVEDPSALTVVQIDAHADLREHYRGSRFNHACAMRRILELGVKRLVAIGIRSAEREEFRLAASDPRIETFYAHQLEQEADFAALLEHLRAIEGPVHLTVDADGLEVHLCPGTGTPQPGGLAWNGTMAILRALLREGKAKVIGADLCETVPQPHSQVNEMVAARLAFKIAGYRFAPRA